VSQEEGSDFSLDKVKVEKNSPSPTEFLLDKVKAEKEGGGARPIPVDLSKVKPEGIVASAASKEALPKDSCSVAADAFLDKIRRGEKDKAVVATPKPVDKFDGLIDPLIRQMSAADVILGPRPEEGTRSEEKIVTTADPLPTKELPEFKKPDCFNKIRKPSAQRSDGKKKEQDDEDLPESVKSFLDVMNELDKKNKVSSKSQKVDKHRSSSDKHRSASSSSSSNKKHHRRESDKEQDHRRKESSSSRSKSRHHEKRRDRKESSSSKKHSDSSKHKSSSKGPGDSDKSTQKVKAANPPEKEKASAATDGDDATESSPIPDFTEELDMLPDELGDFDLGDDCGGDGVAGGNGVDEDDDMFGDEEEDDELRKIFDEFKPEAIDDPAAQRKAQKLGASAKDLEGDDTTEEKKKRVAHGGSDDRKDSAKNRPPARRATKISPSQALMQRYKALQTRKEDDDIEAKLSEITEGASAAAGRKRIARNITTYNPNMVKSKLHRQLDARREETESNPQERTVGHTLKGMARISHTPTAKTVRRLEKPMITTDLKAKVPSNVRQRYLDSLVEECLKLYRFDKGRAYERAVKEEESCSARSKNRNIYLNVIVNCIKKLRTEATEAAKNSDPSASASSSNSTAPAVKSNMLTTHMQVLAGKAGAMCSWSIEKPNRNDDDIPPDLTYTILKRYLLTKEQLEGNCYPIPDPEEKGKAVVKADPWRSKMAQPSESNKRSCDRCLKVYRVDKAGHQVLTEECVYHWGRLYKRNNRSKSLLI
jgi:hypothetical protein